MQSAWCQTSMPEIRQEHVSEQEQSALQIARDQTIIQNPNLKNQEEQSSPFPPPPHNQAPQPKTERRLVLAVASIIIAVVIIATFKNKFY